MIPTEEDRDRDLRRLFEEQRRADEASAPGFRDLLTRTRATRIPRPKILRPALTAAAVLLVVAASFLLRRPRTSETAWIATASALGAWRAPTDSLLETPGAELTSRLPALTSSAAPTRLDNPHDGKELP